MLKFMLRAVGVIATGCGIIGIVLPLFPTTPFLLLAAYCFAKSSPRMHDWLLSHPQLGPYITNYQSGAMSKKHKIFTLTTIWLAVALAIWRVDHVLVYTLFPLGALGMTWHISRLTTAR
ncbi:MULTISPECIES: YbaN family protein [Corynebacterium]|uniref:YbaN family protein n=1 Tax=Corynebacterium TaxID=1716 RepID=UPI001CEF84F6|nr:MULTISPECIES: YbaN family protein [Corynebacterium]